MHKGRKDWIREERSQASGICFEPLEPRLLLSGSWGEVIDSSGTDRPSHTQDTLTQKTLLSGTDTDHTGPQAERSHLTAAGGVDLLAQAPVLIPEDALESTIEGTVASNQVSSEPIAPLNMMPNAGYHAMAIEVGETRELILVNEDVADYDRLIDDLRTNNAERNFEVIVLDAHRDGVSQVTEILSNYSDLSAMHVITHGAEGQINLGNTYLDSQALQQYSGEIDLPLSTVGDDMHSRQV